MGVHSLFGRVVELVFVWPAEALLYSAVIPEPLHGGQKLVAKGLGILHPGDHVHHHLGVRLKQCEGDDERHITEQEGRTRKRGWEASWQASLDYWNANGKLALQLHALIEDTSAVCRSSADVVRYWCRSSRLALGISSHAALPLATGHGRAPKGAGLDLGQNHTGKRDNPGHRTTESSQN